MRQANETRLEMRARKLGDAVSRRVDMVSTSLRPPGQRPSFTTMLSNRDALSWWLRNYNNPQTGGAVLARMDPMSQMELHAALSKHIEEQSLVQPAGLQGASLGAAQTLSSPSMQPGGMGQ